MSATEVRLGPSRTRGRATGLLGAAALVLCLAGPAFAQETGRVVGHVTDEATGEPIAGAQIVLTGTGVGTISNDAGRYILLNVPAGTHTLRVRIIGYASASRDVTVSAGGAPTVDFQMEQTAIGLDEIVVTGTAAEVRRKEVGNSIDGITAQEIEAAPVADAQTLLAGRAPGLTYMQSSGQPGSGATVKIRGTNSVTQDGEPLIYVDGVRIFNLPTRAGWGGRAQTNPLQDINPDDIARVEIVKGASATTLYGTEASAGVIQIFTKQGISGDPIWSAEITTGVSQMNEFGPESDDRSMYTRCSGTMRGIITSDDEDTPENDIGTYQEFVDPTCPEDGDWFQPGPQQNYHLSVRGGLGDVTYYMSGSFGDARGTLPTQGSKDGGFRGNFAFSPIDDLTFRLTTAYTRRSTRWAADGNNSSGFLLNVGRGYRNYLKGGKGDGEEADCAGVPEDVICVTNQYLFDDSRNLTRSDHFIAGFVTEYNPTPGLTNRFAVGWDYSDLNNESTLLFNNLDDPEGYYWDENTRHTKLSLDYAGSYRSGFGEDIASTFSWGGQIFRDRHRWTEVDVHRLGGLIEVPTLETGAAMLFLADEPFAETNAGFFLQEMVGWQDRLFLTGGLRVDGSSAFGEDFGLQTYPKLSVSYVLSDYDFWPTDWAEAFKLRGAIGESGKAPSTFASLRTWQPVAGDENRPGFTPDAPGNPNVGPERTREIEAGFDLGMFDGRLGIEATAYEARTFDALVDITLPPSSGFLNARQENAGEVTSEGLEFQVTGGLIRARSIDWTARVNFSFMRSEVVDVDGEEIFADNGAEFREGYAAPTYFGDLIVNPNEVADPVIVEDTAIGAVFPTKLIGVGTTLRLFDNITLNGLLEYQGGHYLPNFTGYQNARRGAWQPCFAVQEQFVAYAEGDASALDGVSALERAHCALGELQSDLGYGPDSDFWVEKADFVKLRTLSLTYELPAEWVQGYFSNASVTLAGRNLMTWTDYTGTDPEVEDAADRFAGRFDGNGDVGRRDYYTIPPARTFLFTLRFGF